MNKDIPGEHQMLFIIRDYDRKVEENMELRKEVEELSSALATQETELKKAKRKNEKLTRQVGLLFKCIVYVRNQTRHLLSIVEVPGLHDLEQRMSEALKKYVE